MRIAAKGFRLRNSYEILSCARIWTLHRILELRVFVSLWDEQVNVLVLSVSSHAFLRICGLCILIGAKRYSRPIGVPKFWHRRRLIICVWWKMFYLTHEILLFFPLITQIKALQLWWVFLYFLFLNFLHFLINFHQRSF